jgi:hypothetical protein
MELSAVPGPGDLPHRKLSAADRAYLNSIPNRIENELATIAAAIDDDKVFIVNGTDHVVHHWQCRFVAHQLDRSTVWDNHIPVVLAAGYHTVGLPDEWLSPPMPVMMSLDEVRALTRRHACGHCAPQLDAPKLRAVARPSLYS